MVRVGVCDVKRKTFGCSQNRKELGNVSSVPVFPNPIHNLLTGYCRTFVLKLANQSHTKTS